MTPILSVVTGTRNREESLKRLVSSVVANTPMPYELVIADASDEPIDESWLPAEATVLAERPRLGYVKGHNRAFSECSGTWVLWLNDDAEVLPGYAEESIAFMESHPQIGLGALHYSEDGGPFHCNSAFWCIYANFGIIRRALGEQVGWLDTDFEMYGSDNALTFQVLLAGYGVSDIPGARVIHHSVKDHDRISNQLNRPKDNNTLTQKYMPRMGQWRATYERLKVDTGTVPWVHGVPA